MSPARATTFAVLAVLATACGSGAPAHAPTPVPMAYPGTDTPDYERRDQPVTADDLRILERADAILASPDVWNRHDTRECHPTDTTWSLFCALEAASLEVLGEYRHREVALQEVRFAVEEATRGMDLHHRLMDFNNLPSTTFADVKGVIAVARDRVRARLTPSR